MSEPEDVPQGVDPNTMSIARVYDYLLGGTLNYPADRAAAEHIRAVLPELEQIIWCNRGFHQRATKWLAATVGIDQFVDIGSGLPTEQNTHEIVQQTAPEAHVVYVDNDPVVELHVRHMLCGNPRTGFVAADARKPETVLSDTGLRALIDLDRPVGLLMTAVVHFVDDESDPWGMIARYLAALAPGSYLVLSHCTGENWPPETVQRIFTVYQNAKQPIFSRTRAEVERFFDGLRLVSPYEGAEPAVCFAGLWAAEDPDLADDDASRATYCGVARKP